MSDPAQERLLPAWSLPAGTVESLGLPTDWPGRVTREWAWGDSTGKGVRVCILDSGIDPDHPMVGGIEGAVAVEVGEGEEVSVVEDSEGDLAGHGTAGAGIVRSIAPDCILFSVRVLGAGFTGSGTALLGGLRWAVEQGFDVINMSLSTTKRSFAGVPPEVADAASFRRTVLVASAHNMPVESYPWRFSSVISVGSHEGQDPFEYYANPSPPAAFFPRGGGGGGGGGRDAPPPPRLHRQQLRDAAHRRDCSPCSLEASGADAVPAQEPALSDSDERGGWGM